MGGHTWAVGYHLDYYYSFNSNTNQLNYSTEAMEIAGNIVQHFVPGDMMTATSITVRGILQGDEIISLAGASSASSGPSSSSSSSASSSIASVSSAVSAMPSDASAADLALSIGLVEPTAAWKTNAEIAVLRSDLGYVTYVDPDDKGITLDFANSEETFFTFQPASYWAQAFLPNLWIGQVEAMLAHYATSTEYNKYVFIVDLQGQCGPEDYGITRDSEKHIRISVEDDGSDTLLKLLEKP